MLDYRYILIYPPMLLRLGTPLKTTNEPESELSMLKGERNAAVIEKTSLEQSTTDLRLQLSLQVEALGQEKRARQAAERSLTEAEAALGAVSVSLRELVQR
jgi:hypothetical protein